MSASSAQWWSGVAVGSIVSLAVVGLGSMAWMADNSAPPLDARHEVLDEAAEDSWRGNNVDANLIKGKTHRLYLAGGRTADAPEPALATSVPKAPHEQTPDPQAPSGSRFRPNMDLSSAPGLEAALEAQAAMLEQRFAAALIGNPRKHEQAPTANVEHHWTRLDDNELYAALAEKELASLNNPEGGYGRCTLAGSVTEGIFDAKAIFPQKAPMLGASTSMRQRWSGWKGTTMAMIARALANRNSKLMVVGDSMGGQLYRAMKCGIGRYGGTKLHESKGKSAELNDVNVETASFSLPPSTASSVDNGGGGTVGIAFINANNIRVPKQEFFSKVMEKYDALVYNEGLWFNRMHGGWKEQYTRKMEPVLQGMQKEAAQNSSKLLMFKETSAQHFFSHSGDGSWETFNREAGDACWTPDAERPTPNFDNQTCNPRLLVRTCVPTPDGTNWRNEVVSEIIEKGKLHQIRVLKWFEYTLPRWDLHEDQRNISIAWKGQQAGVSADCGNRNNITGRYQSKCLLPNLGGQDCTHFSYTPFLYEPMWDEIAEAMAARWGVDVRANV